MVWRRVCVGRHRMMATNRLVSTAKDQTISYTFIHFWCPVRYRAFKTTIDIWKRAVVCFLVWPSGSFRHFISLVFIQYHRLSLYRINCKLCRTLMHIPTCSTSPGSLWAHSTISFINKKKKKQNAEKRRVHMQEQNELYFNRWGKRFAPKPYWMCCSFNLKTNKLHFM